MKHIYCLPLCWGLCHSLAFGQSPTPPRSQQVDRVDQLPGTSLKQDKLGIETSFEERAASLSYNHSQWVTAPSLARSGKMALLLNGKAALVSTALLPVDARRQVTATIYANYARKHKPVKGLLLATSAAAIAYGQSQQVRQTAPDEQLAIKRTRKPLPFVGAGIALSTGWWPKLTSASRATLRYRIFNADRVLVATGEQRMPNSAQSGWEALTISTTVPAHGFVQISFENNADAEVLVDDLKVAFGNPQYSGTIAGDFGLQNFGGCGGDEPINPDDPIILPDVPIIGGGDPPQPGDPYYPEPWDPWNPGWPDPNEPENPGGGWTDPEPSQGPPILTSPQIVTGECNGLQTALALQASNRREVAGFVLSNGLVFLLPMTANTHNSTSTTYPLYDGGNFITSGPYRNADGSWSIDINDWSSGSRVINTYNISYAFHTHPIGTSPDGGTYLHNTPSDIDYAFALGNPGMTTQIVNAQNIVTFNATSVTNTTPNPCP